MIQNNSIIISDGSFEHGPYVMIEIIPGRWPFQWWYEVSYWDANNKLDDKLFPCWVHYYQKDGGRFTFWRVMKKAQKVLADVWFELAEKNK